MNIIKRFLLKIAYAVGIKKRKQMTREEVWKARGVKFGKNFNGPDSEIDFCYGHLVEIGDNVTISGTTILAHDGSTKNILGYVKVAPVRIGSDVFIGFGSVVLPGVTIGSKVIVGAGTVISKDIPDNVVVVPGRDQTYRVLCTYDEYVEKEKERLRKLPISTIGCMERTEAEWEDWKRQLDAAGAGFDF